MIPLGFSAMNVFPVCLARQKSPKSHSEHLHRCVQTRKPRQECLRGDMGTPLSMKQQETSPLPEPIRLPSRELHRATGNKPVQLRSKHDQNQPPVKAAESTASITRPKLKSLTKRIVPTTLNRYSRQSTVPVLANGIAKFPVWRQGARLQKKTQPIPVDGNTIHNNAQMCQFHAENRNQHIVDGVQVVDGHQSDRGGFQMFVDREAAYGSSTSSGSTGNSDGSLSGDFEDILDHEAAHGSSTSSGSTGYSDGSLSGDFEDKTNTNFTLLETKTLIRFFPVTFPTTLL